MVRFPSPRAKHPYHMYEMIRSQPDFIAETQARLRGLEPTSLLGSPRQVVVTGCGTSFHAAAYGARLLRDALAPRVVVEAVHAYDLIRRPAPSRKTLVLGVSHSGSTATTNRALARARRAGARILGLCGIKGTPMERVTGRTLVLGSTQDRSWANTMSYTTQLTALAYLALRVGGNRSPSALRAWSALPVRVSDALAREPAVRRLASLVVSRKRATFLGTGLDEITALEAALKIRETCSLTASGYHTEQFLHGPFLSLGRDDAIVGLRSRDDGERAVGILRACSRTGALVKTVGDGPDVDIPLPRTPFVLRPILSVIPLQLLAYHAALARRMNPDVMRLDAGRYGAGLRILFT